MEALVHRLAAILRRSKGPAPRRLQTAQDVVALLHEQVELLRAETETGAVAKARVLGYLANIARKAIETAELSDRLDRLEAALAQRSADTK
jgi:hypothetical protein